MPLRPAGCRWTPARGTGSASGLACSTSQYVAQRRGGGVVWLRWGRVWRAWRTCYPGPEHHPAVGSIPEHRSRRRRPRRARSARSGCGSLPCTTRPRRTARSWHACRCSARCRRAPRRQSPARRGLPPRGQAPQRSQLYSWTTRGTALTGGGPSPWPRRHWAASWAPRRASWRSSPARRARGCRRRCRLLLRLCATTCAPRRARRCRLPRPWHEARVPATPLRHQRCQLAQPRLPHQPRRSGRRQTLPRPRNGAATCDPRSW